MSATPDGRDFVIAGSKTGATTPDELPGEVSSLSSSPAAESAQLMRRYLRLPFDLDSTVVRLLFKGH